MDFKVNGILGFTVRDSFRDLKAQLLNVTVNDDFGFESVMGNLELERQIYLMGVDQNAQTGALACVEVRSVLTNDTFEGINLLESTEQTFAQELAKIGSTPVIDKSVIWWPKERMGFYIFEGIPRTIAWWGTDAINEEIEAIFSSG